jgi:hypothetical protein
VEDGSCERGFHALTLGETGGAAIGDGFHAELGEHLLYSFRELNGWDAAQLAEVGEVFARGEAGVETYVIEERTDRFVNSNPSVVGLEHSTDHAEGSGFAGAVRSQEASDCSVGSAKGEVPDCLNRAEGFFEVAGLDHSA